MRYQHCVLLPISLFLIIAGVVSLLLLGIGSLEPYTHTKDFRMATCTVVYSNISGQVPCKRQDKDEPSRTLHRSRYPCASVVVNYTELAVQYDVLDYGQDESDEDADDADSVNGTVSELRDGGSSNRKKEDDLVSAMNVMLYDTYSSWTMSRSGEANSTCSIHVCHKDVEDNEDDVNDFFGDYGKVGNNFRCYFNPKNTDEVFAHVVTGNNVMHALVWPGLAMGFGLFLLIVVAFLSCEVWICRNPKRAQRRMQGQTYQLASYRCDNRDLSRHGWRTAGDRDAEPLEQRRSKRGRGGDGNNNSRLPNLSAAADIIRKWSYGRGRSDRRSDGESASQPTDTSRSSQSYAGNPSRPWSIGRTEKTFSTT